MTVPVSALPIAAAAGGSPGNAAPSIDAGTEARPDSFNALVAAFFALEAQWTGQPSAPQPGSEPNAPVAPVTEPGAATSRQQTASENPPSVPVQASAGAAHAADATPVLAGPDHRDPAKNLAPAGPAESDTPAPFAANSETPAAENPPDASTAAQKNPHLRKSVADEKPDEGRKSPQASEMSLALALPAVLAAQVLTPVSADAAQQNPSNLAGAIDANHASPGAGSKVPAIHPAQTPQPDRAAPQANPQSAPPANAQPLAADAPKLARNAPLPAATPAQQAPSDAANATPAPATVDEFARAMAALAPPLSRAPANGSQQPARDKTASVQQASAAKTAPDQPAPKISGNSAVPAQPQSANQKSDASAPPVDQDSRAAPSDPQASQQPAAHGTSAHTASTDSGPAQPALASSAAPVIMHAAAADSGTPAPATQSAPDVPIRLAALPGGTDTDFAQLALHVAVKSADGDSHFLVRLDPPELGRVEVNLDVDSQGNAHASLSADQPNTLDLLQRDAPALERALRDAGLALAGGLSFSLKGGGSGNGRTPENNGRARTLRIEAAASARNAPVLSANLFQRNWGAANARLDITV